MPKMALNQLLSPWVDAQDLPDRVIESISNQSASIQGSGLFLAYKNKLCDRVEFIAEAVVNGAIAVALDAQRPDFQALQNQHPQILFIAIPSLAEEYGDIAARFYGDPTKDMTVIGVTGTNGKSSTAYFIAQALNALGKPCAFIGTIGLGLPGQLKDSPLTSLDPIAFQRFAAEFKQEGIYALAIEMSSHALDQNRLAGVHVDTTVLTQITSDHLDYHKTLGGYKSAKEKSMQLPFLKQAILNLDDDEGYRWLGQYHSQVDITGYGSRMSNEDIAKKCKHYVWIEAVFLDDAALTIHLNDQHESFTVSVALIGRFNVENIVASIATLKAHGYSVEQIQTAMQAIKGAPGRMQLFGGGDLPTVYVDYAHTTDGLQKALEAVQDHGSQRLVTLFGCGGDRDVTKRAPMGKIAARYSDIIILTSDNPRDEDPDQIVEQIKKGVIEQDFDLSNLIVENNREKAIQEAIFNAAPTDVLLIAGKGHERTQKLDGYTIDCNDRAIVTKALQAYKKVS
jgi:UDP-N-acetylmuramoyl-L-alanyl-D-glutamate--2,6-diaminopimelate ligase